VGHGSALGALDQGWEALWVAVDGGQRVRRGPVRGGGRNREKGAKWACANARASAWGAQGCARGPEEGVVA
jgi:hypothetical protein